MTRFQYGGNKLSVSGSNQKLSVMVRNRADITSLHAAAEKCLVEAKRRLTRAEGLLDQTPISRKVRKYAHRYFLTPENTISAADLRKIRRVVTMVKTGLEADVVIKTGATVGRNDNDVWGAVSRVKDGDVTKPYHTVVPSLEGGDSYTRSAMRIDSSALESGQMGILTLVHEASHKYAGTVDKAYFDNKGMTPDTVITKADGLKNADSFAWFVMRVGTAW